MFRCPSICLLLVLAGATSAAEDEAPLRDPMRPFEPGPQTYDTAPAIQRMALTGILVSENRRIAVIDKQLYRVGDRVDGAEIIRIDPGSIRIRRGADEQQITLRDERTLPVRNDGDQDQ